MLNSLILKLGWRTSKHAGMDSAAAPGLVELSSRPLVDSAKSSEQCAVEHSSRQGTSITNPHALSADAPQAPEVEQRSLSNVVPAADRQLLVPARSAGQERAPRSLPKGHDCSRMPDKAAANSARPVRQWQAKFHSMPRGVHQLDKEANPRSRRSDMGFHNPRLPAHSKIAVAFGSATTTCIPHIELDPCLQSGLGLLSNSDWIGSSLDPKMCDVGLGKSFVSHVGLHNRVDNDRMEPDQVEHNKLSGLNPMEKPHIESPLLGQVNVEDSTFGPNLDGPESLGPSLVDQVAHNFKDKDARPSLIPPRGFAWEFLERGWVLIPSYAQSDVILDTNQQDSKEIDNSLSPSSVKESPDVRSDSDHSVSEFVENIKKILPGMYSDTQEEDPQTSKGTRRSERPKKPSSRFNEEAGFVVEPPRSTKKKGHRSDLELATVHVRSLRMLSPLSRGA